ncbi:MAG: hypothetical protein RR063_11800, partial [Anaerovoracaceae bacterium]
KKVDSVSKSEKNIFAGKISGFFGFSLSAFDYLRIIFQWLTSQLGKHLNNWAGSYPKTMFNCNVLIFLLFLLNCGIF